MFSNNNNNIDNNIPTGNNQAPGKKSILIPIMSIAVFMVLIFSAGYAYFTTGTLTNNSATHNLVLPARTSMTCTATPACGVTINYTNMVQNANSTTAKGSTTCYVACTCKGSPNGKCNYTVTLAADGTAYSRTSGANNTVKEYTAQVTSLGTGCTVQNASTTEQQVDGLNGKIIATCSLTASAAGNTANTAVVFKWYNAALNQNNHAGKTYKYKINAVTNNTSLT